MQRRVDARVRRRGRGGANGGIAVAQPDATEASSTTVATTLAPVTSGPTLQLVTTPPSVTSPTTSTIPADQAPRRHRDLQALRSLSMDASRRTALVDGLFRAVWVESLHVSEPGVVARVADAAGLDGAAGCMAVQP